MQIQKLLIILSVKYIVKGAGNILYERDAILYHTSNSEFSKHNKANIFKSKSWLKKSYNL